MKLVHPFIVTLILSFFSPILFAQTYFQQEVNYKIDVRLDDVNNKLMANESIEYINNSPRTLTFIYMHLWPNGYKDNSTPLAKQLLANGETSLYYSSASERGYIDQLHFKIDGKDVKWDLLKDSIDICKIYLNEPLKSGDKINITTPFHLKIPSGKISRLGHIGQSYQITQWYPKPAVYDSNGWNYMPYLQQGEYYSEFGSFDVSITLPKNYVLGATGDMVDAANEMHWLNEKVKETESITQFDATDMAFPPSDTIMKTIRFKQNRVHDFAWFCDKRYHVLKGEIETPTQKNKITTWAMFTNAEGQLWKKSISYINDAIYYYSLWNGDYPYNNCTAVDGTISAGSGMEYPNITVIGDVQNAIELDVVIAHEVGHNWFYGMLGSNERIHPWLDEGVNSFNELRYIRTKYPEIKLVQGFADGKLGKIFDLARYKKVSQYYLEYLLPAKTNTDQPIDAPAYDYTEINYGTIVYAKSAIVLDYLMAYVGEKKMDEVMHAYFNEWKFKHPQPADLRKVAETVSGKNLSWLFDDLINTTKKLDYKIAFAHQNKLGTWYIGVKNTGSISGPLFIHGIKDKKLVGEIMYDGFKGKQELTFPAANIDYFKIDVTEAMPEINRQNNTIRTKGIFKKIEPLKLQLWGSLPNPTKTQLFWSPALGWNNYNKWMFGIAAYNALLPRKKIEFEMMPLYSYSTGSLTGYGHIAGNIFPSQTLFQHINIGVVATRYAYTTTPFDMYFNKIAPEVTIEFKKKYARSPYTHTIKYRNITLINDSYKGDYTSPKPSYTATTNQLNFNDLTYTLVKKDVITPYELNLNVQQGDRMGKASLTATYTHNFKNRNKGVELRLFAGSFIFNNSPSGDYRFRLSGQRGYQDYLKDHIYLGRTETNGILANQFTETDGAFKIYSAYGQSNDWLTAVNIKSSIGNLKIPVKLFTDIGAYNDKLKNSKRVLYDAGICISVVNKIFEIYFPLLMSKEFKDYYYINNITDLEKIRFTLNLNLLNPFERLRNLSI
ncbi:MAG: M1 family metallopeptidase [Bacteroidia bacterium]